MKKTIFLAPLFLGMAMMFSTTVKGQAKNEIATVSLADVYTPIDDKKKPPGYIVNQDEAEKDFTMSVYPNPAHNQISIKNINAEPKDEVAIYNITGSLVLREVFGDQKELHLNLTHLPKGFYFVKAKMEVIKIQLI